MSARLENGAMAVDKTTPGPGNYNPDYILARERPYSPK